MFERLWEEDPKIRQLQRDWKAQGRREGEARGEARGEVKGKKEMIVAMVDLRFPALVEMARQRVAQIAKSEDLDRLFKLLALASDEATACSLLISQPKES